MSEVFREMERRFVWVELIERGRGREIRWIDE